MSRFLPREELAEILAARRRAGTVGRVVLTNGCFELLHAGHVRYLADAKSRGDLLVVAVNESGRVRIPSPVRP